MIISSESTDFNDPKEFDDPQLFDDPQQFDDRLEVWTLIIQKSTVIPPSQMVLFCHFCRKSLITDNGEMATYVTPTTYCFTMNIVNFMESYNLSTSFNPNSLYSDHMVIWR